MARRMARVIVVMGSFLILGVMAYYISNVGVEELSFLDKVWFNSFHLNEPAFCFRKFASQIIVPRMFLSFLFVCRNQKVVLVLAF